jgi:hypothetical protein
VEIIVPNEADAEKPVELTDDVVAEIVFQEQLNVCPESDEELHAYIELYYGYRVPRVAVCPGHCAPFDAMTDLFFLRHPSHDAVWVGGRLTGKTLDFAITEHAMMRFFGDEIANIGSVEAQAKKCYSYIEKFATLPHFLPDLVKRPLMSETILKNGGRVEVLPGTKKRVNSPHPRLAMWDEVDQIDPAVLQEGISMPQRMNGRAPQAVFTSSLKYAYGPMVQIMEGAAERAIRKHVWCVFEVIERCELARHQDGEGCKECPLAPECLDSETLPDGTISLLPGPGKAARADGFMPIDDVIKKYRGLDKDTWDSQWRSKRPSVRGLVYPQWDDNVHIIDYDWNPTLPVYAGIDFGYTNPSAVVYLQVTPDGKIIAFDELYQNMMLDEELARRMKSSPYFDATIWRMGDPAAAGSRATLNANGVMVSAADNTKDTGKDNSGISKIRWLLAPPGRPDPLFYVARRCKSLIGEFRTYHVPEEKDDRNRVEQPVKNDDHALDACRYAVARLVKNTKKKG